MIKVSNVFHKVGDKLILRDVSVDIPRNGITALIGPNGAGKSTVLSLIARLEPLQSGRIDVDDLEVAERKQAAVLNNRKVSLPGARCHHRGGGPVPGLGELHVGFPPLRQRGALIVRSAVDEVEERVPWLYQRHPHVEGREHRGVFNADDPGAHNDQ